MPIIALTSHIPGEEINMMIEVEVDDILTKPPNKKNLMKTLLKFIPCLYSTRKKTNNPIKCSFVTLIFFFWSPGDLVIADRLQTLE